MRHICRIVGLVLIGLHDVSSLQKTAEMEERARSPRNSQDVLAATGEFARAVNGNAIVRTRCRFQGKDIEIEESAEVIERDGCKLVVSARKVTKAADAQTSGAAAEPEQRSSTDRQSAKGPKQSAEGRQEFEFTVYANLSELTTPVLVERQKFAQCEAEDGRVLKVSSRSEPGKTLQVIRKSQSNGETQEDQEVKQTRRDLSLFFSAPAAAEKARKALERTLKACGAKEWPDEDDLP